MIYHIRPGTGSTPDWSKAEVADINNFRPESSDHHPRVAARLLYSDEGIYGAYKIDDQYVRSIRTEYMGEVWKDSCVEFFVQPKPDKGYFNLEMNAGGAHLIMYIEDSTRIPGGFKKATKVPAELGTQIQVRSTLSKVVDPEITTPITWELNFFLPKKIMESFVGPLGNLKGQTWRGNFYKCGDELSHRHWASWSPVDQLNFHLPRCFGTLVFE
jgi:hypothetical protein